MTNDDRLAYYPAFCDDCDTITWHDRDCTDTDCTRDHRNPDHGDCWGIPVEVDTIMCEFKNGAHVRPDDRIIDWSQRHASKVLGRGIDLERRTEPFDRYSDDLSGNWFVVVRTTRHVIEELPV